MKTCLVRDRLRDCKRRISALLDWVTGKICSLTRLNAIYCCCTAFGMTQLDTRGEIGTLFHVKTTTAWGPFLSRFRAICGCNATAVLLQSNPSTKENSHQPYYFAVHCSATASIAPKQRRKKKFSHQPYSNTVLPSTPPCKKTPTYFSLPSVTRVSYVCPPPPRFLSHRNPVGADNMPILGFTHEVGLIGERLGAHVRPRRPLRHPSPSHGRGVEGEAVVGKGGHGREKSQPLLCIFLRSPKNPPSRNFADLTEESPCRCRLCCMYLPSTSSPALSAALLSPPCCRLFLRLKKGLAAARCLCCSLPPPRTSLGCKGFLDVCLSR